MRVTPAYLESVATFYDMLELHPVPAHTVYVCTNISCSLRGADELLATLSAQAGELANVRSFECLSTNILRHHLDVFCDYDKNVVIEFEEAGEKVSAEHAKLKKVLNMSVNEIELSVRAANCLNNANITTVGQLAMKSEQEMLKYRNFGKKSLNEIKEKLSALGLDAGNEVRRGACWRRWAEQERGSGACRARQPAAE